MGVVSFTLRPLYLQYPLDRRLGGPKSRFERDGEEKKSLSVLRTEHRSSNS
jgi:hypothetical protein